ncbi:Cys-tRNA(Pro) deacylase [Enterococcus faecalis]|uniref:Cys-tRNA(Pro) deacylase n=1 Tax=Enterococcus faecalis TaxID=1351 RepID=UPI0024781492
MIQKVKKVAKKKTQQKTNAMRMVEQHKVPYKEYEFAWSEDHLSAESVAESSGIDKGRIFKTLVTVGNKTGLVVAVIPGNQELDLKKLAKASGNKKVEMLHLKDLEATTGYIRGGCSPIGMKKQFPTYLAEEAQQYSAIIVSAGKRGMQIELAPEAILSLTNGQFAEITTKE